MTISHEPLSGPTAVDARKTVFYVNYVAHLVFLDIVGRRPDIRVVKLENDSPETDVAPALAEAVAYQIVSARHDLHRRFHIDQALLARLPKLLVVSASGAGYDTVDLDACTEAGVLAVN